MLEIRGLRLTSSSITCFYRKQVLTMTHPFFPPRLLFLGWRDPVDAPQQQLCPRGPSMASFNPGYSDNSTVACFDNGEIKAQEFNSSSCKIPWSSSFRGTQGPERARDCPQSPQHRQLQMPNCVHFPHLEDKKRLLPAEKIR